MNNCFIFGALDVTRTPVLPQDNDFCIAADKGYLTLEKLNITPDLTVGDFDSLGYTPSVQNTVTLNTRKDDTDIAHCLTMIDKYEFDCIFIYGASGGKLDHSFANIQLASQLAHAKKRVIFIGENQSFTVIKNGTLSFDSNSKGRISVFSLCDKSEKVTEKGLSYCISSTPLSRFEPMGISNEFIGEKAEITVTQGELLVVWEDSSIPVINYD